MLNATPGRMIDHFGATFTLWRRTAAAGANAWDTGAETDTFYTCRAATRGPRSVIVKGTVQEQSRLVVIDARSLAVTPKAGDRIAIGKHTANTGGVRWRQITEDPDQPLYGDAGPVFRCKVTE